MSESNYEQRGEQSDYGTWNLYAYCGGNPVNYVDPSGHNAAVVPLYTYGAANAWNPTGWIVLAAASVITVGSIIYLGGQAREVYKVRSVSHTQVRVKVRAKISLLKKHLEVRTKGNENVRDTGLIGIPEDELIRRLKDKKTPNKEKQRIRSHLKGKDRINTNKNRSKHKSKNKSKKKPNKRYK